MEDNRATQGSANPSDRIISFLESTANLGRGEAAGVERQWRTFLQLHGTIDDSRYQAGKILVDISHKLLEDRTWVQFLKTVGFPRTTANNYIKLVEVVEKRIPSAAVRKILLQYTDPAKKKVLTAAETVLKQYPNDTPPKAGREDHRN